MKILVGLSGGVDSAVTALLLKQQGYEVAGATMSIWKERPDLKKPAEHTCTHGACFSADEKEDIAAAKSVADQIGIPFYVVDCKDEYEKVVLDNFKEEYISGRTPNPCIRCNALVKFGVLPTLAKQSGIEFDKFATGHYARVVEENGRYYLKRGLAANKDQSYFLYKLTQEQLSNIMMPLGEYTKDEIRAIAKENGLDVSDKPDSQDFYEGDYNELLGVEEKAGNIVDLDGKVLGQHTGIWNYTIGQRKGIGISAPEPLYVLELRKDTNEVVVGYKDKTFKKSLKAINMNWIAVDGLDKEIRATAKIRSTQQPTEVTVRPVDEKSVKVVFDEYQKSIAIGQSVVLYDEDKVIGGGIIDSVQ